MEKSKDAFLTIGELSAELDVPHHILRYWETRFPQLRPLQRSGNRRYYRPADVALVRQIHHLLTVEGYTIRGAQQALKSGQAPAKTDASSAPAPASSPAAVPTTVADNPHSLLADLKAIRSVLARALHIDG